MGKYKQNKKSIKQMSLSGMNEAAVDPADPEVLAFR